MIAPYLAHFALKDRPFSKEIADNELWLPTPMQTLVEALNDHASAVLVSEPGAGKTCVLRALRPRLLKED